MLLWLVVPNMLQLLVILLRLSLFAGTQDATCWALVGARGILRIRWAVGGSGFSRCKQKLCNAHVVTELCNVGLQYDVA